MSDNLWDDIGDFLNNPAPRPKALEDHEAERLITSLAEKRGEKGFTEDEVVKVVEWAENIRVGEALLALVLAGSAYVDIDSDGELMWSITAQGKEEVKKFTE